MATQFAVSRFLVPELVRQSTTGGNPRGWALFSDCDVLFRRNLRDLFRLADKRYAVMCVHHKHEPKATVKMGGEVQTKYPRKNWSSVMMFNCDHPANAALTVDLVNTLPGRDLHRFCWLDDSEIGEIGPEWNFLVGHSYEGIDPAICHFTEGLPSVPGFESCAYSDEWREELARWAA